MNASLFLLHAQRDRKSSTVLNDSSEQAHMLSRCWITNVCRTQITTPPLAEPDHIQNNVERQWKKTERIKEWERDPERSILNKNCLSLPLQSWNPLSQLSGWPTSREPQWPADFPGFGAQRVGSRPPRHPEYPHPSCSAHPSSLLHALGLPFRLIVNGCCRRLNQEPACRNNRIHGWIYVRTHLPDKSWRCKPAVPVLPNKNAIVGVNGSFAPGANAHVHIRMEERTAPVFVLGHWLVEFP